MIHIGNYFDYYILGCDFNKIEYYYNYILFC